MKLTKTDAQKKGKKAKYTAKVKREGTKKEVKVSSEPNENKELLATVKTLVTQNKDMMAALKASDNSEAMFKYIADIVISLRDLSMKDIQSEQMRLLTQAQRKVTFHVGGIERDRVTGRIKDFEIIREPEPLN